MQDLFRIFIWNRFYVGVDNRLSTSQITRELLENHFNVINDNVQYLMTKK